MKFSQRPEKADGSKALIDAAVRWAPALACAAFIFFLSHQSDPLGADLGPDYAGHFLAYAGLASTLVWGATDRFSDSLSVRAAGWVVVVSILYGVSDEFHQSFVPGRSPAGVDVMMDFLGAVAATTLLRTILHRRGRGPSD